MKFSIGYFLFAAVMASFITVGVIGVALVRWSVSNGAVQAAPHAEGARLDALGRHIASRFLEHRGWSFLPEDRALRKAWLGEHLVAVPGIGPVPPGTADRIALLDPQRHLLAGAAAHPLLIAIASIDTVERTVAVDGQAIGSLVVARAENPDDNLAVAFLIEQQHNLAILAAVGLALAMGAAAMLAANFRRPIRQLVAGARRLGAGRFETRLDVRRTDELGELARTFNHLAAQLQAAEDSRRHWVASTSHELRTPLSVLRAQLEALHDGVRQPTAENIDVMLRQVVSLGKLVDELHLLAQSDLGTLQYTLVAVDAWQLVGEVLQDFAQKLARAGLTAKTGAAPARTVVRGDVDRLRQVAANLLENCVRHTDPGGCIQVHGAVHGPELHIVIDDSAPGVPAPALPRLGERFFRVDASRDRKLGGAGLGLALSRQMVEAHGGRLMFAPSPLGGLRATIALALED